MTAPNSIERATGGTNGLDSLLQPLWLLSSGVWWLSESTLLILWSFSVRLLPPVFCLRSLCPYIRMICLNYRLEPSSQRFFKTQYSPRSPVEQDFCAEGASVTRFPQEKGEGKPDAVGTCCVWDVNFSGASTVALLMYSLEENWENSRSNHFLCSVLQMRSAVVRDWRRVLHFWRSESIARGSFRGNPSSSLKSRVSSLNFLCECCIQLCNMSMV